MIKGSLGEIRFKISTKRRFYLQGKLIEDIDKLLSNINEILETYFDCKISRVNEEILKNR